MHPAISDAVEKAAASLDVDGVRALRVLLHAGVSAYWPLVQSAPVKQVGGYESTLRRIRTRWDSNLDCVADEQAVAVFHKMDAEVVSFLHLCAERSRTQWLEPIDSIAVFTVALLQGAVLRWLADCDEEALLVVLDDLVSGLATRAADTL